jgi:hypothetical protein
MGEVKRTTQEIQREIERARENLARDVTALEVTFKEKLDLRHHVRQRPMIFLGGALAVGFVIGLI